MNGARQSESQLDEARLRSLIEAGRSLVSERELERVLERLLEVARELTGAGYGAIGVLDGTDDGLAEFLTAGAGADTLIEGPLNTLDVQEGPRPTQWPLRLVDPPGQTLADDPAAGSFLAVPILIRGEPWGTLFLSGKDDEGFDEGDEEAVVVLAAWAAVAIENAWLYRQTDERRIEQERSIRALEATSEIARAVGGETRLDRVLELIANRSRSLVEASGVVILLSEGDEFSIAATAGNVPRELIGLRIPARRSTAGRVLASGRPERISDVQRSPEFVLARFGVRPRSALFVPLLFRGAQVGVIEAFDRVDGPEFRVEDERMLLAAAASAATAVATAQSVERERLRRSLGAAEEERSRWARELHDDTLQALGALRVLLSSARRRQDVASLHAALDGAVQQLGQEIANLRALITELRPAALDQLGLAPALEALFDRVRGAQGLQIESLVKLGGRSGPRLSPEIETAVYRVVQESLTNAVRHARAERVEVEVQERSEEIRIAIRDDGRGFDLDAPSRGFGLSGMRERISLAGGRLDIRSAASGTQIEATLPSAGDVLPSGDRAAGAPARLD